MTRQRKIFQVIAALALSGLLAACGGGGRTIQIGALDELAWEPASVTVEAGETVTFEVRNEGELHHEFVLGSEEVQEAHEMAAMEGMDHEGAGAEALAVVELPPGETQEVSVTFEEPGEILYGCHEPGHYDGGMVGTVTVE
jgi:uncharacterized cupredoxin-like copper-binding protein